MTTRLLGLVLGFPPVHGGARKKGGTPDALQEGMAAPKGVTALVSAFRQGFLLTPQKNHARNAPSHSTKLAAHQLAPPRSCNHHRRLTETEATRPTRMKKGIREQRTAEQRTRGRERPPPPMAVTDQTHQQEQTRPFWPGRARGLVKLPSPRCSRHAAVRPPPPEPPLRPPEVVQPRPGLARPDPDGARRAQIWADRAPPASPHHPTAKERPPRRLATRATPLQSAAATGTPRTWGTAAGRGKPRATLTSEREEAGPPPAPRGLCPAACADGRGGGGGGEGGAAAGEVSPRRPPAGDGAGLFPSKFS
jgi:hypothetical protein